MGKSSTTIHPTLDPLLVMVKVLGDLFVTI